MPRVAESKVSGLGSVAGLPGGHQQLALDKDASLEVGLRLGRGFGEPRGKVGKAEEGGARPDARHAEVGQPAFQEVQLDGEPAPVLLSVRLDKGLVGEDLGERLLGVVAHGGKVREVVERLVELGEPRHQHAHAKPTGAPVLAQSPHDVHALAHVRPPGVAQQRQRAALERRRLLLPLLLLLLLPLLLLLLLEGRRGGGCGGGGGGVGGGQGGRVVLIRSVIGARCVGAEHRRRIDLVADDVEGRVL